jgi:carboxypeptidase Taq
MRSDLDDMDGQLACGDLSQVKAWLRDRVWSQGSRHELQDLLRRATGKPLGVEDFKAHLMERYGE